ncbi:MAG: GNAT family N-acetyltransferase [Actinobacteria bacterium]|nr:GNAT family N-acetyltransferase [Actinomycetota bacterium]
MFSSAVTTYWKPESAPEISADFTVVIDPTLSDSRSVSVLSVADGRRLLTVTPARAEELALSPAVTVSAEELVRRLAAAGLELNGPDHLFYLPVAQQEALRLEPVDSQTRPLTDEDAPLFDRFTEEAPEDDLDDAFVELDHWLVFGTILDGRLVSAASMYPWDGSRLADLGVITLPEFRGRGFGRTTVRAMSALAIERGYEPQYRCQFDNASSVALAASAGFALFGDWDVVATE